jgi:hypothetical protein
MKRTLMQLSISCVLGLLVCQANAGEHRLASGQSRDCSQMTDAKKKASCEETNKVMEACAGKAGDEMVSCMKAQHKKK